MRRVLNARLPQRVEQKLADYCVKRGVTRSEAVVRALDRYLDEENRGIDAYSIAADLIPARGISDLQSSEARRLARKSFLGSRSR